jgi:acyl-CoA synthetase (AMP-forming)/AMP-acid ligase II
MPAASRHDGAMTEISALLRGVLEIAPEAGAVEFEQAWACWGDLSKRAAQLRALFDELGLGRGARIGVMLRNRLPQLEALLAVLIHEGCLVTLNPSYPDALLAEDIKALKLPVIIGDRRDLARDGILQAAMAQGTAVVALPQAWSGSAEILYACRDAGTDGALGPEGPDVIIEMLTSGTTGRPKRVALTKAAFQHSFEAALAYEAGRDATPAPRLRGGIQVLCAPLTHIGGIWGAINTMAAGRKCVLLERFTVAAWHDAVLRHRPRVGAVPSAALRMVLDAGIPKQDLSSLTVVTSGAAPVDPEVIDEMWERYEIPVLANYGATEFAGPVAGWSLPDFRAFRTHKRGAAGRLHAGVEARIVEPETGAILPHGKEGLLELRSAQLADPLQWLRTTDRAILDADDFLFIKGRADGAIVRGGFKVHPEDVVRALERHPAVREAVVVGIPDQRLGQVPAAAVMLKAGVPPPPDTALAAHLRACLLPYQIPVLFDVVADVPRTPSMKPILPEVAALLARRRNAE